MIVFTDGASVVPTRGNRSDTRRSKFGRHFHLAVIRPRVAGFRGHDCVVIIHHILGAPTNRRACAVRVLFVEQPAGVIQTGADLCEKWLKVATSDH